VILVLDGKYNIDLDFDLC